MPNEAIAVPALGKLRRTHYPLRRPSRAKSKEISLGCRDAHPSYLSYIILGGLIYFALKFFFHIIKAMCSHGVAFKNTRKKLRRKQKPTSIPLHTDLAC